MNHFFKQRYILKYAILILPLFIIIAVIFLLFTNNTNKQIKTIDQIAPSLKPKYEYSTYNLDELPINYNLILINRTYPLITPISDDELILSYKKIKSANESIKINEMIAQPLQAMFTAAKEAGFSELLVTSGYRSTARQKNIYESSADKAFVQPPTHSEHESGLAVDLKTTSDEMEKLGETEEGKWLHNNVWQYGFILRYPENKFAVTNIAYEPWHFRYVGEVHATYMSKYSLALEEYITLLTEYPGLYIQIDNTKYLVLRAPIKENGTVELPKEEIASVSLDNTGGVIATLIVT